MKFNNPYYALVLLPLWCVIACQDIQISNADDHTPIGQAQYAMRVCADGETVRGIDVSEHQGEIDWDAVAADGIEFAYIRVSDSLSRMDPYFERNWQEAERVGLLRGVYQYFRPSQDPIEQAQVLLDAMGPIGPDILPPMFDIETDSNQTDAVVSSRAQLWLDTVENATGVRPIVYTYPSFWAENDLEGNWSDYLLWIANYGVECPLVPDDWNRWAFFQYSSTGAVDGIGGNVDLNDFNGSYADLQALAGQGEPCDVIPESGATIDVSSRCFRLGGPRQYWRIEEGGYNGGSYYWTNATANADSVNTATWYLHFQAAGVYDVDVYIADDAAETMQALYTVEASGSAMDVRLDQSTVNGWAALGQFDFESGGQQRIVLVDNSGEPNSESISIVADALRLTPAATITEDVGVAADADVPTSDATLDPIDMGVGDDRPDADIDPIADALPIESQGDIGANERTDAGQSIDGPTAAVRAEGTSGCIISRAPHQVLPMLLCAIVVNLRRRRTITR